MKKVGKIIITVIILAIVSFGVYTIYTIYNYCKIREVQQFTFDDKKIIEDSFKIKIYDGIDIVKLQNRPEKFLLQLRGIDDLERFITEGLGINVGGKKLKTLVDDINQGILPTSTNSDFTSCDGKKYKSATIYSNDYFGDEGHYNRIIYFYSKDNMVYAEIYMERSKNGNLYKFQWN